MGNDPAALAEVAKRRAKHFTNWGKPDLIIVDGGLSQLRTFLPLGVPVVVIAKPEETLVFPQGRCKLPAGPARNLIVRIRNESHRFAQKYHNLLVKKDLFSPKGGVTL